MVGSCSVWARAGLAGREPLSAVCDWDDLVERDEAESDEDDDDELDEELSWRDRFLWAFLDLDLGLSRRWVVFFFFDHKTFSVPLILIIYVHLFLVLIQIISTPIYLYSFQAIITPIYLSLLF